MNSVTVFSPAKLNLFLAVTGRRPDGFHDLLSLAVTVEWGDTLKIERRKAAGGSSIAGSAGQFALGCSDPRVPLDESNLVLRAAGAFQAATAWKEGADFFLEKRVPMSAGLGGGSSNAAAALRALNALAGEPLGAAELAELAARIGSDCALFLQAGPAVMRGRGERIEPLKSASAAARLRDRRVLIFKPDFGVATAWAYAALSRDGRADEACLRPAEAEARLADWLEDAQAPVEALLFNHLEKPVFKKFVALPSLLAQLAGRFGLAPRMTGSGSACYALLGESSPVAAITGAIREAWGASALVVETRIATG